MRLHRCWWGLHVGTIQVLLGYMTGPHRCCKALVKLHDRTNRYRQDCMAGWYRYWLRLHGRTTQILHDRATQVLLGLV